MCVTGSEMQMWHTTWNASKYNSTPQNESDEKKFSKAIQGQPEYVSTKCTHPLSMVPTTLKCMQYSSTHPR